MGINLVKGQNIDLRKNESGSGENNLSKIVIGLGWDVNKSQGTYDLDAVAVLLDKNGKMSSRSDIVYYGSKTHPSGKVELDGDNLTGAGEGDDEQITVNLNDIPSQYEKIVFFTSIYQGRNKGQNFGKIENAYIRAVSFDGKKENEIARYKISGDQSLSNKCSFVFAEAYKKDGTWKFRALGDAHDTDSLNEVAALYS